MFGSLRTFSFFSFLRAVSSPEELACRASQLGHSALCLTDWNGVYGAVQLQQACKKHKLKPLIGCTVAVADSTVSIIAKNAAGYHSMNCLISNIHDTQDARLTNPDELQHLRDCWLLHTYTVPIRLHHSCSQAVVLNLQRTPGEQRRNNILLNHARHAGLPVCIAPEVRYARADNYALYDVVTCIRVGCTVFDPHPERPVNDQQYLRSESELQALLPYPDAMQTTRRIIQECNFDIVPGFITPPSANIPEGASADVELQKLCDTLFHKRYDAGSDLSATAKAQLEHELTIIKELKLSDFFLVVREIIMQAQQRNILYSGRGSAANSIVAYVLEITNVCPIRHHLLFERFLHKGRKGTPDIDVDFDSDRRQEIIAWMEQRFGREQTSMTATLITYQPRMAIRDIAKALGWTPEEVRNITRQVPVVTTKPLTEYMDAIAGITGPAPLLSTLVRMSTMLLNRPRHLGLHNGGMILSAKPLTCFTPLQRSANGTSVVQFDKDDVEAMGLVKFDVLGLRMLACINEALELIELEQSPDMPQEEPSRNTPVADVREIIRTLPPDIPSVMQLIRSGKTIGVFQIESQGQMHLLAQHQPECFNDLITEVALFRPGPLQGGMVHPYIRRRRGKEAVTYLHPSLEPILSDTLGIVLFQEQVLEIAHRFAGMPLDEADDFRILISKNRDSDKIAELQNKFIKGAMARGISKQIAEAVYDTVRHFVGYGFCRSHAAAFAAIVYQSAWLKAQYPAAYMAAFMQHRPGFYNLMTLEEEARRCGVPVLMPHINKSGLRYKLERTEKNILAIRKPLTSISGITEDIARPIVWERYSGYYHSVEELWERTRLSQDVFDSLALSGALDDLEKSSRSALWKSGVLGNHASRTTPTVDQPLFYSAPVLDNIPELPPVKAQERLAYDYQTHGAARLHPMTLFRRYLSELGVLPIQSLSDGYSQNASSGLASRDPEYREGIAGNPTPYAIVAGIVILRQSPPTARGVLFVTIEDETGYVQCVVEPNEREYFRTQLRQAALIVKGIVCARASWRGLLVREVAVLQQAIGGYAGHPSMYGGTDVQHLTTNHPVTK